jgi:hypothetical protein
MQAQIRRDRIGIRVCQLPGSNVWYHFSDPHAMILAETVIIPPVRVLVPAAFLLSSCAFCQQAPVTRAEFAELFDAVAKGYVAATAKPLPVGFVRDATPVTRSEIASAMLIVALAGGKPMEIKGDPLKLLQAMRIMPETASLYKYPGSHFRPNDLVAVMIAFSEGMANRHQTKSIDERLLSRPGGDRIHGAFK